MDNPCNLLSLSSKITESLRMMDKIINPFVIKGFVAKELFCDREKELSELMLNIRSGVDTTLIAIRRMGKTGLIMRTFSELEQTASGITTIYVDIYSSRNLSDFVKLLAEAILKKFPEKTLVGQMFLELLKTLRPLISYDSMTGEPQVTITYQTPAEKEYTLQGLLAFLEKQASRVVVAIDEFQQITEYPEQNVEALLRTYIQQMKNVTFIFCGSKRTLMIDMFGNVKRPFYSSTRYLHLDRIAENEYAAFIQRLFTEYGMTVEKEAIDFILFWTECYTFYTQSLCHLLFSQGNKNISIEVVKQACLALLNQNEPVFLQYREFLTSAQWNFLIAVAKERTVTQITSQRFISAYHIGTPANARRIMKSLIDKELILSVPDKRQTSYRVYDVFFSRWLEREY